MSDVVVHDLTMSVPPQSGYPAYFMTQSLYQMVNLPKGSCVSDGWYIFWALFEKNSTGPWTVIANATTPTQSSRPAMPDHFLLTAGGYGAFGTLKAKALAPIWQGLDYYLADPANSAILGKGTGPLIAQQVAADQKAVAGAASKQVLLQISYTPFQTNFPTFELPGRTVMTWALSKRTKVYTPDASPGCLTQPAAPTQGVGIAYVAGGKYSSITTTTLLFTLADFAAHMPVLGVYSGPYSATGQPSGC
ncbi:MAG: hypothetical protein ACYCYK_11690 [Candidatus Dormibacteria bacterium]